MNSIEWNSEAQFELIPDNTPKPRGITPIACINLIGGAFIFYYLSVQLIAIENKQKLNPSTLHSLPGAAIMCPIAILSGVGLLLRRKWGWWLAIYYYFSLVLQHFVNWHLVSEFEEQLREEGGDTRIGEFYLRYGFCILWDGLLLRYLIRPKVLDYLKVSVSRKSRLVWAFTTLFVVQGVYFYITKHQIVQEAVLK